MKLNTDFAPVTRSSSNMETAQATIEMTAHMFQILSSGIYQFPELACVRETSCNGWDGQVAAGTTDKPMCVHIPNPLEPYYEVRDFGTGMTHEQVMKLYLTYGASTKRDDNDAIGGLGIGSKSPFAVAQSFTVTSYVDGTVRRYSIYMENGKPQVTKLTESATTEPNGVAVRVAVPMDKIQKFKEAAENIYEHFPVRPECNCNLKYKYDDLSVFSEKKDVFKAFTRDISVHGRDRLTVGIVMGNIEYPIELKDLLTSEQIAEYFPMFIKNAIGHVLIYLPIGSVNIAASRESLQLTDKTRELAVGIFKDVMKGVLQSFQQEIDAQPTLQKAIYAFFQSVKGAHTDVIHSLMKRVNYHGKSFEDMAEQQAKSRITQQIDQNGKPVYKDIVRGGKVVGQEPVMVNKYKALLGVAWSELRRRKGARFSLSDYNNATYFSLFKEMNSIQFSITDSVFFMIDDRLNKNGTPKATGRNDIIKGIFQEQYPSSPRTDGTVFVVYSESEIDELCNAHFYDKDSLKIFKLSDYEHYYTPRKVVRGQVKIWVGYPTGNTDEVKIDPTTLPEPQYYIKAQGNEVVNDSLSYCEPTSTMKTLAGFFDKPVYMFRKATWNRIPEDWIEIDEQALENNLKEHPEYYIQYNRDNMRRYSGYASPRNFSLTRLGMRWVASFEGRRSTAGYTNTNVKNEPISGLNVEDNIDELDKIFGKVSYMFASEIYDQNSTVILDKIVDILPNTSKLKAKIYNSKKKVEKRTKNYFAQYAQRNPLFSWIDYSKVGFRKVAEHLGYKFTAYVAK